MPRPARTVGLAAAAAALLVSACQGSSDAGSGPGPLEGASDSPAPSTSSRTAVPRWRLAVPADQADGTLVSAAVLEGWGDPGRVESANGGEVVVRDGAGGNDLRFPHYAPQAEPPLAVLVFDDVVDTALDPQGRDFGFEVDLRLDAASAGNERDNGDNVLQRGLVTDPAQFKLQVDRRRPSCTFHGSRGRVVVPGGQVLQPDEWYRVRCERRARRHVVSVSRIRADGSTSAPVTRTRRTATGVLRFPAAVPFSVGGKVEPDGRLAQSADQFNGRVSRAVVELLG